MIFFINITAATVVLYVVVYEKKNEENGIGGNPLFLKRVY